MGCQFKKDFAFLNLGNAAAYFRGFSSYVRTSDKTLSSLKTPRLSAEEITELMDGREVQYTDKIDLLLDEYRAKFDNWMRLLHGDFNIVCFGLGSKRYFVCKVCVEKKLAHWTLLIRILGTRTLLIIPKKNSKFI